MYNIPISKTIFSDREKANILKPLESGWVVQGPFVKEFEEKWSTFTGAKYSFAVSNCTTALHLSLAALGIGNGDEVIIPAFTWIATANAVESLGARPVFCDIRLDTFNIDVSMIEALITANTKAIIPVHLFGLPAEMDEIMRVAQKHNLYIVEDAACGFAARLAGKHVGNFGDTGCFSFHPRKAITTGEGGMLTTNNDELAVKIRAMRDHGATMSDHQRHFGAKPYLLPEFPYMGFNYRMTDIQASIGSTQMDNAHEIFARRNEIATIYTEALSKIDWIVTPALVDNIQHGFQAYVCLFKPEHISSANIDEVNEKRNKLMEYLQVNGISTRPGTHAVHMLEYYRKKYNISPSDFVNAFIADHCSIALPIFPALSMDEQDYIIKKIENYNF